MPKV
jgi:hypothetical protein